MCTFKNPEEIFVQTSVNPVQNQKKYDNNNLG